MLVCESIFSRTSLDARPQNFLKSEREIYTAYLPSGASKMQFSLALQLQFTNSTCPGQAPMSSPGWKIGTVIKIDYENQVYDDKRTIVTYENLFYFIPFCCLTAAVVNHTDLGRAWRQGLSQDFHNRVSKLGFQEFRVSKIPD